MDKIQERIHALATPPQARELMITRWFELCEGIREIDPTAQVVQTRHDEREIICKAELAEAIARLLKGD